MTEPRTLPLGELDERQWALLAEATEHIEKHWRASAHPDLAELLPDEPAPVRDRILVELIKIDQELRWRAGEPQHVEPYLERWPELAADPGLVVELLDAECLTRSEQGDRPTQAELSRRFPDVCQRIDLAAAGRAAEEERRSVHEALTPINLSDPSRRTPPAVATGLPPAPLSADQFGRYRIRGVLGHGGMGTVYLADDEQLHRPVALKIPRFDPDEDSNVAQRFLREARAAAAVDHPGVCPVYDAGRIDGICYLAMARIEGVSLAERIKQGAVGAAVAVRWVAALGDALDAVHAAGLVHRDLKPSNVMITDQDEPMLMDFGLARPVENIERMTNTGSFVGTLPYAPPEQLAGQPPDRRSDVYGLGVVLYELLTGERPFAGSPAQIVASIRRGRPTPPHRKRPELDPALDAICLKAMARNPAERFSSGGELAEALRAFGRGDGLRPAGYRRRALRVGLAVVLTAVLVLLAVFGRRPPALDRRNPPAERAAVRWIDAGPGLNAVEPSRDGKRIYTVHGGVGVPSYVRSFDSSSGELLAELCTSQTGLDHKDFALSDDGRFAYTTNYYERFISRFDLSGRLPRVDLPVGGEEEEAWGHSLDLTPDGKRLVVMLGVDGRTNDLDNDRLLIVDVADGGFRLAGDVKLDDEPRALKYGFSRNSRRVYLISRRRKSAAPMLYEVSLVEPHRVTRTLAFPGGDPISIAMSNRAEKLFIADRARHCIHLVDPQALEVTGTWDLDGRAPTTLQLDPSEQLLAVLCAANRSVLLLDTTDGTELGRAKGLHRQGLDLEFSPDGRTLFLGHTMEASGVSVFDVTRLTTAVVFASDAAGESYQIYLTDLNGKRVTRLTNNHATDRCPRFSPDGRTIAFISDRDGPPRIFLIDRLGNLLETLERTDPVFGQVPSGVPLDWSPDAARLVFVGDNHRAIRTVDVHTGRIETLLAGPAADGFAEHHGLCWSEDGRSILLNSQDPASAFRQGVFLLDVASGEVERVRIEGTTEGYGMAPVISPDGKTIAFCWRPDRRTMESELWAIRTDGPHRRRLPLPAGSDARSPRFTPRGGRLVFSLRKDSLARLHTLTLPNGPTHPLGPEQGDQIDPDVWCW